MMSMLRSIWLAMNLGNSIATGPGIAATLSVPAWPSVRLFMVRRACAIRPRIALDSVIRCCASGTGMSFLPITARRKRS